MAFAKRQPAPAAAAGSCPLAFMVSETDLQKIAQDEGISLEQLTRLLTKVDRLPRRRREDVWRFERPEDFALYLDDVRRRAEREHKPLSILGIDIKNLGGLNAVYSEPVVNRLVIDPLLEMTIAALKELCACHDGAWWQLFHYGGDEYVAVVYGVNEKELIPIRGEMRESHVITRCVDTVVRDAAEYCTAHGLDLVPHPKSWWRIGTWGTGIAYGIYSYDPDAIESPVPAAEMLKQAFTLMQRYKRGLGDKRHNPVDPTIRVQLKRMFWLISWAWMFQLFKLDWTFGRLLRHREG